MWCQLSPASNVASAPRTPASTTAVQASTNSMSPYAGAGGSGEVSSALPPNASIARSA
jgi:hypothetical protein